MRLLMMMVMVAWPGLAGAAERPKAEPPKKPVPVGANPCAQYGPGFVPVQGTTTCVKVGGSIRVDIGSR